MRASRTCSISAWPPSARALTPPGTSASSCATRRDVALEALLREPSRVDGEDMARDILGGRRGEKEKGPDQVLRLEHALKGRPIQHTGAVIRIVDSRARHLGSHVRRSDRGDSYAVACPLHREGPGHADHS